MPARAACRGNRTLTELEQRYGKRFHPDALWPTLS
jgi:hypothetical protein